MKHTYECSDCGALLAEPVEENAHYVRGEAWGETKSVKVPYALVHTQASQAKLDEIASEFPDRDRNTLGAEAARAGADNLRRGEAFSIPQELFDKVEIATPIDVRENAEVALTVLETEERTIPKTALVCDNCVDAERDEILWGPDGELEEGGAGAAGATDGVAEAE